MIIAKVVGTEIEEMLGKEGGDGLTQKKLKEVEKRVEKVLKEEGGVRQWLREGEEDKGRERRSMEIGKVERSEKSVPPANS